MWIIIFFMYALLYLAISSLVSLKLKNVENVQNIVYINDIILLVTTALLASTLTMSFTINGICERTSHVNYAMYAIITMVILNVILNILSAIMISNPQFKNCPVGVSALLSAGFILNLAGTAGGIVYALSLIHI